MGAEGVKKMLETSGLGGDGKKKKTTKDNKKEKKDGEETKQAHKHGLTCISGSKPFMKIQINDIRYFPYMLRWCLRRLWKRHKSW